MDVMHLDGVAPSPRGNSNTSQNPTICDLSLYMVVNLEPIVQFNKNRIYTELSNS